MITCDAHPTARVDYFCKRHSKLVCQGCLVTAHGDHLPEMVPLEKSCLDQYMQTAIKEMQDYRDRVQTLVDTCVKLNETDITVSALEFISLTKIIEKLLGVGSGTSQMQTLVDVLEKKTLVVKEKPFVKILTPSKFSEVHKNLDLLSLWLKNQTQLYFDLSYRLSEDGSMIKDFH